MLDPISVKARPTGWTGVSYSCASCGHVLSVGVDPMAIKRDIVEEIADLLRKG
jgi:hypothetical protein